MTTDKDRSRAREIIRVLNLIPDPIIVELVARKLAVYFDEEVSMPMTEADERPTIISLDPNGTWKTLRLSDDGRLDGLP